MHNNRSLARELSLISLGLIKDKGDLKLNKFQIEEIFDSALDSLITHCRDELDICESELENASQKILDSELQEGVDSSFSNARDDLPDPERPVITTNLSLGISKDIFFNIWEPLTNNEDMIKFEVPVTVIFGNL